MAKFITLRSGEIINVNMILSINLMTRYGSYSKKRYIEVTMLNGDRHEISKKELKDIIQDEKVLQERHWEDFLNSED